jgi:hypothetical protein
VARVFSPESFTVGVALVALGALWTAANLGHLEFLSTLRTWWPLSLVVWGGAELASALQAHRERLAVSALRPSDVVLPSQLGGDDER